LRVNALINASIQQVYMWCIFLPENDHMYKMRRLSNLLSNNFISLSTENH